MVKTAKQKFPLLMLLVLAIVTAVSSISHAATDSTAPTVTSFSPAAGVTLKISNPTISFTVSDTESIIKNSNYFIKLNGVSVNATLQYPGRWTIDYYGNSVYRVSSYNQATISFPSSGLADGTYKVDVQASDQAGNIVTKSWSFTLAVPPAFSAMSPVNGSVVNNGLTPLQVKIADNGQISSAALAVDGNEVSASFQNGILSYTPQTPLADGYHAVTATAADAQNNSTNVSWGYYVQTQPPALSFAQDGTTIAQHNPALVVALKSAGKLSSNASDNKMYVDGQLVSSAFSYKGHWKYSAYSSTWVVDSVGDGTLSYTPDSLTDGKHTVAVCVYDPAGNYSQGAWTVNIAQPPVFSEVGPYGSTSQPNPTITVKATDPNGPAIDWSSLVMKVDGDAVPDVQYDTATGVVGYSSPALANDAFHHVNVQVADTAGNLASTSWQFFGAMVADVSGFSNLSPLQTTPLAAPAISTHLKGSGYVLSSLSMTLDGIPVVPKVNGTVPELQVVYTPAAPLSDGTHTVALSVYDDIYGTINSPPWEFTVEAPPSVTNISPKDNASTVTGTPVIAAYTSDNSGISSAVLTISNKTNSFTIVPQIDKVFSRISYQVLDPLEDGIYTAALTVSDLSGNTTTQSWQFTVDTKFGTAYPDMPAVNDAACWTCHRDRFTAASGGTGQHPAPQLCGQCHSLQKLGGLQTFKNCTSCHYNGNYWTYDHYGLTAWQNVPNRKHQLNDVHLSSTTGCETCHSRILTQEHFRPERTDTKGNPIDCNTCHTGSFLGEELSTNGKLRVDTSQANLSYGYNYLTWMAPAGVTFSRVYLDMNTTLNLADIAALNASGQVQYYLNPNYANVGSGKQNAWLDTPTPIAGIQLKIWSGGNNTGYLDVPKVQLTPDANNPELLKLQNAIADKKTDCATCHGEYANHDAVHQDGLDEKCLSCHKGTLTQEHLNNTTTAGRNLTCDSCHASADKAVKRSIAAGNLSCSGCHTKAHTLNLMDKTPVDLPLYSEFSWSQPLEAAIFSGEPTSPAGYESGQVLLSSRLNTVTAGALWNFYNTGLTGDLGWKLKSAPPADGAASFVVEYVKGTRALTLKAYNTLSSSLQGDPLPSGYRMEIWYK